MSQLKVNTIRHTGASSDAVTLASDGTCTAKITNNLSNRRININGAMIVAQRNTSSTDSGYATVDRNKFSWSGTDENCTQEQVDVASGTTPYTLGLKKAYKVTNGNQTSGAGTTDYVKFSHNLEGQDVNSSAWNFISSSSYITYSFWIKSSVAQNFYGYVESADTTKQAYPFETGSISADTWTKITKTIPGNPNSTINNDNGRGLTFSLAMFYGTDKTGTNTLNQWKAYDGNNLHSDIASTWYTTNNATFEITGLQIEAGTVATDFEHRSYGDELLRCQRYCCQFPARTATTGTRQSSIGKLQAYSTTALFGHIANFPVEMRTSPTATTVGTIRVTDKNGSNWREGSSNLVANHLNKNSFGTGGWSFDSTHFIAGGCATLDASKDSAANYLQFTAEL